MKKVLFLLSFLCLYVAGSHAAATARIMAYDLRLTTEGENYTFTFKANEAPTEATLVFYSVGTGKIIGEKTLAGIVKGANSVTLSRNELPGGGTMNWGVKLHAGAITEFGKVHAATAITGRGQAVINALPESNFFGYIYYTNRTASTSTSGLHVYNPDYTKNGGLHVMGESALWGAQKFSIDSEGNLWLPDYTDSGHSGVYIVNPANLNTCTQFYQGTRGSSGLWTNSEVNVGGSSPCAYIYGEGTNAKLYTIDEDMPSYTNGLMVYNVGQPDGTITHSWNTAPSQKIKLADNSGGVFSIGVTEQAIWLCQNRANGANADGARSLMAYNHSGTRKYVSTDTELIPGSLGGGLVIDKQGLIYIPDANGHILVLRPTYSDAAITVEKVTQYDCGYNMISSMSFDYAGNLIASVSNSGTYNNSASMQMAVFTMPTEDNTCTVPAKKSLTVYGPLSGTFNIGGDDAAFTSLASAMDTLEHYGMIGDVTFRICADLTENKNIGIANNTVHKISIIPDGAVKRTITYGDHGDNAGPSGHIIIGESMGLDWTDATATQNVIIDGSYNGDGQYLEFRGGAVGGSVIVIYGDVTNTTIRNCRIVHPRASGTNNALHFRTAKSTNNAPHGVIIENCYLYVPKGTAQAIQINGSQATNALGYPKDNIIRNCEIVSTLRGIFFNYAGNTTIEGNTINIYDAPSGYIAHGIMGSVQSGTIIVRGNKFTQLTTKNTSAGEYGIRGITASGGATKWIIENNYFGGIDAKASGVTSKDFALTYIHCGDDCEIRHNTFYMPSLTYKPATAITSGNPITCLYLAGSHDYPVENNLFVSEETTANNSLIRGALNANVKNNVFHHAGGNAYVVAGASSAQAFNNLASTYQSTNKWQQVEFETGSYIPTTAYLNNINLGVEHLDGFNYDIEGNTRNFPTRAGCYDPAWCITLDQTATDNTDLLTGADGIMVDAVIKRSFGNDGWYTLVLPFDATVEQLTEVFGEGYKVAVLKDSRWKSETDMYLNFEQQSTIEAGVPCLIKPATSTGSEIVFHNVTIDKDLQSIETDVVDMIGLYNQTTVTLDADNYYLGNGNLLYEYNTEYASSYALTNGFRAYFHFNFPLPAGCSARVIFREDTATEIEDLQEATTPVVKKVLRDEQLIIIRDGKEYNVQGQLVR